MTYINSLASETKQKLLSYLPFEDLATMCLVSRIWNLEAEHPRLWENYDGMNRWSGTIYLAHIGDLKTLIKMKRFKDLKKIAFSDSFKLSNETFHLAMKNLQNLQSVDLRFCHLTNVQPTLLAAFLAGLKEIKLGSTVTENQKIQIFSKLEEMNMLRILYWPENFVCISPTTLASVLSRLDAVDLSYCSLNISDEQKEAFFTALANKEGSTKFINFDSTRLSSVEPVTLARGLLKVETLDLQYTYLTQQQVTEFFKLLGAGASKLKKLEMSWEGSNLEIVDEEILATGVNRLEYAEFCSSRLTFPQLKAILEAVDESSNLTALDLRGNKSGGMETSLAQLQMSANKYCKVII